MATDGDMHLGGRDWDARLIDHIAQEFLAANGFDPREDSEAMGKLIRDCKEAKETLSSRSKTSLVCNYGNATLKTEVTRKQFLDLTIDLLDRTEFTVREALKQAGMIWADIDRVLLVGGSTRMPAVSEMLSSLTGKTPDTSLSPDEAVAHGAAIRSACCWSIINRLFRSTPSKTSIPIRWGWSPTRWKRESLKWFA